MMRTSTQRVAAVFALAVFAVFSAIIFVPGVRPSVTAQAAITPTPTPATPAAPGFDQAAALAKLREQIKGHEQEPAEKVFKNIQMPAVKQRPAASVLAMMEMGYARSLGVDCTHCHVPDKWESDEKVAKGTTRDMAAMAAKINNELLKGIKTLPPTAVVNCTTCHRGQIKPALNLPTPPKT